MQRQKVGGSLGTACQHFQHTGGDRVADDVLVEVGQAGELLHQVLAVELSARRLLHLLM